MKRLGLIIIEFAKRKFSINVISVLIQLLVLCLYINPLCYSKQKTTTTAPTPGTWGKWESWGECSKTCAIGVRRRVRTCSYTGRQKAKRCIGNGGQLKNCDTKLTCPIHGGWSAWEALECTVTCGGGDGKQKRTCTNPKPKDGGNDCEGQSEEEGKCNTEKCPDQVFTLSPKTAEAIKNSIDKDTMDFQKKEGDQLKIPCSSDVITGIYEDYPRTSLMWTKNGHLVRIDHERMTVTPTLLTINQVKTEDSGVYVCSVHYAPLIVKPVSVAAVSIMSSSPDIKVPAKESMKLLCHGAQLAKIYKNATQKWLLNDAVFKDFGSASPLEKAVYEIDDVKPNMTGKWSCQITDKASGRKWTANVIMVKVLPARLKFLRFLTNRNVLLALAIVTFILVMLIGTVIGYVITKTRDEFMAEFEKWCQIVEWEEIKAGGVPKWAKVEEVELNGEEETETEEELSNDAVNTDA